MQGYSSVVGWNRHEILKWFSGRARANAEAALDLLAESEASGAWFSGAKRKVEAALTKSNVAEKLGKQWDAELSGLGNYKLPESRRGFRVVMLLRYGQWRAANTHPIDFDFLVGLAQGLPSGLDLVEVVQTARQYQLDFAPLAELMDELDIRRPIPEITYLGASPTVTQTLAALGLVVCVDTVRVCPIEWHEVRRQGAGGKLEIVHVGVLKWPPGTVHEASRYAGDSEHCHACGHAIRNPSNWVPLVIDNDEGVPFSLWVGRDCAETLCGIKIKGEMELEPRR